MSTLRRRLLWLLLPLLLAWLLQCAWGLRQRQAATFYSASVAPNQAYRAEKWALESTRSKMLIRVFGADGRLLVEVLRVDYVGHPQLGDQWSCKGAACSEYRWGTQDEDAIRLPPPAWAAWLARIP